MDGVYLIALFVFAALSVALLGLCATLGANGPVTGAGHDGPHSPGLSKDSAGDRGL